MGIRITICLLLAMALVVANAHQLQQQVDINHDESNTFGGAKAVLTCDLCKTAVKSLQDIAGSGSETWHNDVIDFAIEFCTLFKIEKATVCQGIIPLYRNETFEIVANRAYQPEYICGFVGICPFNPANFSGQVNFPTPKPPHVAPVMPPKGGPTKTILHLTDFHIDQFYVAGMNAECGEPVCCRAVNGPGSGTSAAGEWGDYRCDVNMPMVHNMMQNIVASHPAPDYIFWTGDNPPHDVWMQTQETQLNASAVITDVLAKYFPGSQVFAAIGNHEGVPVNSFPEPPNSPSWLYQGLANDWATWLAGTDASIDTLLYGGYYSAQMMPGVRVMSLNMNWCNNQNIWMIQNITDPASMIAWAVQELQAIENAHEHVYIIGHIPSGVSDCIDVWSQQLYQVVDRYEDSIIGLFFGHTHHDQFQLYHDAVDGHTTAVSYIAPSVTTYTNQNPSYRIYTVDEETGYLLESSTYRTSVAEANQQGTPIWALAYNATTLYNMPDLFPETWQRVAGEIAANSTLLETYYVNYYAAAPYATENPCTSRSCKLYYECEMNSGYSAQITKCESSKTQGDLQALADLHNFRQEVPRSC
ncbi:hypothetical protein SAMD00019534_047090, partial [Acytostelium subglobosum LB1]|uniref:hypothetical protein n=1 Tax=Acytostelium subglobosum LB1 TaxID=1410327 RepID=UPI00064481F3